MADQHFVLLGRELRRCDEIVQARISVAQLQDEIDTRRARQQEKPLQCDAEIRMTVAVHIARDDGVAVTERLAQLALHTGKILNANEGEIVVAGVAGARLGIDGANVDDIANPGGALREIGNNVPLRGFRAAVGE